MPFNLRFNRDRVDRRIDREGIGERGRESGEFRGGFRLVSCRETVCHVGMRESGRFDRSSIHRSKGRFGFWRRALGESGRPAEKGGGGGGFGLGLRSKGFWERSEGGYRADGTAKPQMESGQRVSRSRIESWADVERERGTGVRR